MFNLHLQVNLIKKKRHPYLKKKTTNPHLPIHHHNTQSTRPAQPQQITLTSPSPIHMSRNIPTHTSTSHPHNSLLHIRPLRFSRNSHISNIINIQSTITTTQSSSSTLLTIPLKFIDRLESRPNRRRNNRYLRVPLIQKCQLENPQGARKNPLPPYQDSNSTHQTSPAHLH